MTMVALMSGKVRYDTWSKLVLKRLVSTGKPCTMRSMSKTVLV